MKLAGWTTSVVGFIIGSILVFATNLAVLIWATTRVRNIANDGSFILQEAHTSDACAKQKQLNTWIHLLINIFSTIILGGSNYCMQCLSAPTRADINKAHCYGEYLDIGVSNLRNLVPFKSLRAWLWLALGVSSLPLHLFYNSAIYRSTSSNNYAVFSVGPDFVQSGDPGNISNLYDLSRTLPIPNSFNPLATPKDEISRIATNLQSAGASGGLTRLDAAECVNRYVQTFQSEFRNVILVTKNTTSAINYVEARFWRDFTCNNQQAYAWACGYAQTRLSSNCLAECDREDMMARIKNDANTDNWSPLGSRVDYCLAEPTQGTCRLEFNLPIAITVVTLNLVKIVLMLLVFRFAFRNSQHPILTYGDAVSSFLTDPDPTTRYQCLLSKRKVISVRNPAPTPGADPYAVNDEKIWHPLPRKYKSTRRRWGSAVSVRRWILSIVLYVVALSVAAGYLGLGINSLTGPKDMATLWRMGIGSVSNGSGGGKAIVFSQDQLDLQGAALLFKMVILANIPQLILSLLYFSYNAIFTIMLSAKEWASFALERKGLRIASKKPVGDQRDSYWLQLPYRWSIPLMVFSILLHWLVSQSIFLVNVNFTNSYGDTYEDAPNSLGHLLSLGYSPLAILAVILVGVVLILFAIIVAIFRRFASGMPIVANNSVAISAACHTMSAAPGEASRKLQWGETGMWSDEDLTQPRAILRETDSGFDMPQFNFRAKHSTPSSTNSRVNLIQAEYVRVDRQQEVMAVPPDQEEDYNLSGSEYWHCGFSSEPVYKPSERKLYI